MAARIGSRSWLTTRSVPPGATAFSRLRDTPAIGRARDRRVLRRHEIERLRCERIEQVHVGVVALDVQTAPLGFGGHPVQRTARDVVRRHLPALLGQPDGIASLSCADVERSADDDAADLVDERAVRVAAPQLLAAVAVIPVGLVGRRSRRGPDVIVGQAEADHRPDPAAVGGGLQHLLARVGHVAGGVDAGYRRCPGRVDLARRRRAQRGAPRVGRRVTPRARHAP